MGDWMSGLLNAVSSPVGHGFTQQMIENEFTRCSFLPRAGIPIGSIVLDDAGKFGGGAAASLDRERCDWFKKDRSEPAKLGRKILFNLLSINS